MRMRTWWRGCLFAGMGEGGGGGGVSCVSCVYGGGRLKLCYGGTGKGRGIVVVDF